MGNVKKSARVADADIIRLNHVGLSLKAIAEQLGCHAATITLRLKALKVAPTDTRRSFMEQVYLGLTQEEQHWLSHFLNNNQKPAKDFVIELVKEAFKVAPPLPAPPPPVPEMASAEVKAETPAAPEAVETATQVAETQQVAVPVVEAEQVASEQPVAEPAAATPPTVSLFS